jgi:hypothetical protein
MDKLFLADTYTAVRSYPLSPDVIQVRTPDLSNQAFIVTTYMENGSNVETKPKFVFRRCGDQYFLAQVWLGGAAGHEIWKSTTERKVARLASEPEWISIAAKQRPVSGLSRDGAFNWGSLPGADRELRPSALVDGINLVG